MPSFSISTIKNSLLIKWVLTAVLIVTTVFGLLTPSALKLLDSVSEEQIRNHDSELAILINSTVAISLFSHNSILTNETLSELFNQPNQSLRYIIVYDTEGSLFAQAGSVNPDVLPTEDNNLSQARQDGVYDTQKPLKLDNQIIGRVRYGFTLTHELDLSARLLRQGTVGIVIALLATVALFSLFGFRLVHQLKKLIVGTHAIAAGDYTIKVNISSDDEIGQLSHDFNIMADAVREKTEAIQKSEQQLNDIVNGSIQGIGVQRDWHTLYVNKAFVKMFGYDSVEEVMAVDSIARFISPREQSRLKSYLTARTNGEYAPQHYEFEGLKKDGSTFMAETIVSSVNWEGEPALLHTLIDISDRKKAEQRSAHYLEQLAQLNRVNTLGEMTAGIAHEINQPLTSIVTRSGAARRRIASQSPDLEKIDRALEAIAEQALRAGNVMQRMRDLVGVHQNERDLIDPNELLEEALKIVKIDGTLVNTRIDKKFTSDLPPVLVDKIQIQQVIHNLLRNAQDAMQTLPPNERIIVLKSTRLDDQSVQISVSDKGVGIDAEAESQLLNSFFTTKETGMGMGLSICRTIITAHAGQLWFSRNADKGVTFHITLPVVPD